MAAPDQSERPAVLPPCNEPSPWDWDDHLAWTLRCGIARKLDPLGASKLASLVDQIGAWSIADRGLASAGAIAGLLSGVRDAVTAGTSDLIALVRAALTTIAYAGEAATSLTTWEVIQTALTAAAGADTQKAIQDGMADIAKEDPEFVEAVVGAGMAIAALRGLEKWVNDDPKRALWTVLLLATDQLGELLGDVGADLSAAEGPFKVGSVVGDYVGQLFVAVLRVEYGI
jgi:hypothetical protein